MKHNSGAVTIQLEGSQLGKAVSAYTLQAQLSLLTTDDQLREAAAQYNTSTVRRPNGYDVEAINGTQRANRRKFAKDAIRDCALSGESLQSYLIRSRKPVF